MRALFRAGGNVFAAGIFALAALGCLCDALRDVARALLGGGDTYA